VESFAFIGGITAVALASDSAVITNGLAQIVDLPPGQSISHLISTRCWPVQAALLRSF